MRNKPFVLGIVLGILCVFLIGAVIEGVDSVSNAPKAFQVFVDDSAFGVASDRPTPFAALLDDTSSDTVDEGDIGVVRMSSSRVLKVVTTDAAGTVIGSAKADDDQTDNCTALTTSSQQYTLPDAGDEYIISVTGNTASVLCGSNPTATTSANGHFIKIPDGAAVRLTLDSTKCAFIAGTATGEICFVHLNDSL